MTSTLQKFAARYGIPESLSAIPATASIIHDDGTTRTTIVWFNHKQSDAPYMLLGKYLNGLLIDAWKLSDECSFNDMIEQALD